MKNNNLIAIHGLKRSGKGVVSQYLVDKYGYKNEKFAHTLKEMTKVIVANALSLDVLKYEDVLERYIESDLKEVPIKSLYGKSARFIMQTLYQEWSFMLFPDMWHRISDVVIKQHLKNGNKIIIDDLRCQYGYDVIQKNNGCFWRIERVNRTSFEGVSDNTGYSEVFVEYIQKEDITDALRIFLNAFGVDLDYQGKISSLGNLTVSDVADTFYNGWFPLLEKDVNKKIDTSNHKSEQLMDKTLFNHCLVNDGNFYDLYQQIDYIMNL